MKNKIKEILKEVASKLQGLEYRTDPSNDLKNFMREKRIVAVLGASDDLVELYGAIDDEIGADTFYITKDGLLNNECSNEYCPYFKKMLDSAYKIEPLWCKVEDYSFAYQTTIPHETFEVLEDGEKYCLGIVFSLDHLQ